MDSEEKFPEERIGVPDMMRNRAERCVTLAMSCEEEAREQTEAAARLRARAARLRDVAVEYKTLADVAERKGVSA